MLGAWYDSGLISAPTAGQVLVDTGQLPAGVYQFTIFASASVAAVLDVERRDSMDQNTISVQRMYVTAMTTAPDLDIIDQLADQERIHVKNVTLIATGTVSVSIILRQLSSG